jgi:hypothetical protein
MKPMKVAENASRGCASMHYAPTVTMRTSESGSFDVCVRSGRRVWVNMCGDMWLLDLEESATCRYKDLVPTCLTIMMLDMPGISVKI